MKFKGTEILVDEDLIPFLKLEKNAERNQAREWLREAKQLLDDGRTDEAEVLISLAKPEYMGYRIHSREDVVWRCRYCQHLVSRHSECPDHPRKPAGWKSQRRSLQRLMRHVESVYRNKITQMKDAGALLFMEGYRLNSTVREDGYTVTFKWHVEYWDNFPYWVPQKCRTQGVTFKSVKPYEYLGYSGSGPTLEQLLDPELECPERQYRTLVDEDYEKCGLPQLWEICPNTRDWLIDQGENPNGPSIEKWAHKLFVGERANPPEEIRQTISDIGRLPALAWCLVATAEAWLEVMSQKVERRERLQAAVEEASCKKTIRRIARKHSIPRSTLSEQVIKRSNES